MEDIDRLCRHGNHRREIVWAEVGSLSRRSLSLSLSLIPPLSSSSLIGGFILLSRPPAQHIPNVFINIRRILSLSIYDLKFRACFYARRSMKIFFGLL